MLCQHWYMHTAKLREEISFLLSFERNLEKFLLGVDLLIRDQLQTDSTCWKPRVGRHLCKAARRILLDDGGVALCWGDGSHLSELETRRQRFWGLVAFMMGDGHHWRWSFWWCDKKSGRKSCSTSTYESIVGGGANKGLAQAEMQNEIHWQGKDNLQLSHENVRACL